MSDSITEVFSTIQDMLEKSGIFVKDDWLLSCLEFVLKESGSRGLKVTPELYDNVFRHFLLADFNVMAVGSLKSDLCEIKKGVLEGKHILQMNEMTNIGEANEHKFSTTAPRTLKLALTDGKFKVYGFEYQPLPDLNINSPAGMKIVVKNPEVRMGIMYLTPYNTYILGGKVPDLMVADKKKREMLQKKRGDRSVVEENVEEIKDGGSTINSSVNSNSNNSNNTKNNSNPIPIPTPAPSLNINNFDRFTNNTDNNSNNNNITNTTTEIRRGSGRFVTNTQHMKDTTILTDNVTTNSKFVTTQYTPDSLPLSEPKKPPPINIEDDFTISDTTTSTSPKFNNSGELSKNNKKPRVSPTNISNTTTNTSNEKQSNTPALSKSSSNLSVPQSPQSYPNTPTLSQSKSPYVYLSDILPSSNKKIGHIEAAKIKGLCTRVVPYGKFGMDGVGLIIDDGTASVEMSPSDELIISIIGIPYSQIFKLPQAEMVKKGRSLGNMLASLDGVFAITYTVLEGEKKFTLNTFSKPSLADIWKFCNKFR